MTRLLKTFLCHANIDKSKVKFIYDKLIDDGIDAWIDEKNLLPGQNWREEIPKAIQNSDVVIVFLSKVSISKSGYRHKETLDALEKMKEQPEGTIFLIPALLEPCTVPERMKNYTWVNLYEPEGYERLLAALTSRAVSLGLNR